MSMSSIPETIRGTEPWAEVRAHDQVMRYRRIGVGRPVLMLHSPDGADSLWPELLDTLGASYRVIVPDPPDTGADVTTWLTDFLEGLGATSVRILASGRFCMPVVELALLEAVGITRLVLVADGPAAPDQRRGFLRSAFGRGSVPLLVVRRTGSAAEGVAAIAEFLRQETAVPA